MNDHWEMAFVESGSAALDAFHLARQPFDVIVTDMRMPGMDGVELLKQIIRLILSGYGDKETTLRTVGLTHQYLSKPCDQETLKATLIHAYVLRDLLATDELKKLIAQMESLPSLPSLHTELMRELQSPDASIKEVGRIIFQDIGMTARILQLVNSPFFGLRRQISDPGQAVVLLGLETVKDLVFSIQVFAQFNPTRLSKAWLNSLQEHSLLVGTFARRIAEIEQVEKWWVDYAVTAGLLHDVGKLILATNLPEQYEATLAEAAEPGANLLEIERERFKATHAEVGAYLLGLWGLPDPVVEALAFHHIPMKKAPKRFSPLTAVHVANAMAHQFQPGGRIDAIVDVDAAYLAELGLEQRVPLWLKSCQEIM
jgi:putative nucleotidyltransferase with HDIG domain